MSMILLKIVVDPKGRSTAPEARQQLWAHMDSFFLLKGFLISSSEHLNETAKKRKYRHFRPRARGRDHLKGLSLMLRG